MTYEPPKKDFLFGDVFGDIFGDIFAPRSDPKNPRHDGHVSAYYMHILTGVAPPQPPKQYDNAITAAVTTSSIINPTHDLLSRVDALEQEVRQLKQLLTKDNHGTP